MSVSKATDKLNATDFAQKLLIYFKYSHSSSIHSLNLIDLREKTVSHSILEECKRNLQNIICDLYKRSGEMKIEGRQSPPFLPIKVCKFCERTFSIRVNQFRYVSPGFTQYRKDIPGKRFSDHPTINHLNIIDYSRKAYDFVPHTLVKKYEHLIYPILYSYFENQIMNSHSRQLPYLLPKLVSALKLLNLESGSTPCLKFYSRVVDSIREKHYDEPLLLLEVWKSLLISDHMIVRAFEKLTDHFPNLSKEKLRWVLVMASYLRFDLYGAWVRGNKLRNFSNCPVTTAMLMGDYDQMKLLLDYGFLQNSQPLTRYNVYLRHLNRFNKQGIEFFPLGLNFAVREVLMFLVIKKCKSGNRAIPTMMEKCFYLLWSSIPYPMITKQQLMDENTAIYLDFPKNPVNLNLKAAMEEVIDGYDDLLLDVGKEVTPRYLHHLCRCSIRHYLTVAGNLPHGVRQLPLCKTLQEYLLVPEEHVFGQKVTNNY